MRRHLRASEAAHLGADRFQRLVETGIPEGGGALAASDQRDEPGAVFHRVALGDQRLDRLGPKARDLARRHAERVQADDFALAPGKTREDLVEVFPELDAPEKLLGLAEASLGRET